MNLYFLVEGETEKQVYRAWVSHLLPRLAYVSDPSELQRDQFCVVSGGGQPQVFQRIEGALKDIRDYYPVDHFFVCVDAEEWPAERIRADLERQLEVAQAKIDVLASRPRLGIHAIVQHCCIETWFLGHEHLPRNQTEPEHLLRFRAFYDVRQADPESMPCGPGHHLRPKYHEAYLRELLLADGIRYKKRRPRRVIDRDYLDALRKRAARTGHLASLARLLEVLDRAVVAAAGGTALAP